MIVLFYLIRLLTSNQMLRQTIKITTRIKSSLSYCLASKKPQQHEYDLIYGVNPVEAAFHANKRQFISLMLSDSDRIELSSRTVKIMQIAKEREMPIIFAPKEKMSRLVDNQPHQNIILKCSPIPFEHWTVDKQLPKGISLYCDKITDPQNFGAVLRSALFFGVNAVFTGKKNHCPLNTTVSKTSSGAMELMQIYGVNNSSEFFTFWKSKGGTIVSTGVDLNKPHTTAHEIKAILKHQRIENVLVVLGSEGKGVSPHLLSLSDYIVAIQRRGPNIHPFSLIDSLNVSAAASTLLFQLTRPE